MSNVEIYEVLPLGYDLYTLLPALFSFDTVSTNDRGIRHE